MLKYSLPGGVSTNEPGETEDETTSNNDQDLADVAGAGRLAAATWFRALGAHR